MKRTALKPRSTPLARTGLRSRAVANGVGVPRRRAVSPASPEQRAKVSGEACSFVGCMGWPADPAHLIDRSLTTVGQDDPLAVVPLCRAHHDAYDQGGLDLLPHLEPRQRRELAFAVQRVGLAATFRRVTNTREAAA